MLKVKVCAFVMAGAAALSLGGCGLLVKGVGESLGVKTCDSNNLPKEVQERLNSYKTLSKADSDYTKIVDISNKWGIYFENPRDTYAKMWKKDGISYDDGSKDRNGITFAYRCSIKHQAYDEVMKEFGKAKIESAKTLNDKLKAEEEVLAKSTQRDTRKYDEKVQEMKSKRIF